VEETTPDGLLAAHLWVIKALSGKLRYFFKFNFQIFNKNKLITPTTTSTYSFHSWKR